MNKILTNAQILTMQGAQPQLIQGSVVIEDNRIAKICEDAEPFIAEHADYEVVDCQGMLVMPGLINTHCHVAMTLQRGMADDIELIEWLNKRVWPFEAVQSDDDIESGARLGIAEMLLGGVTTFVDMYWSEHRVARAVADMGIRALLTESCLDGERMENFERNLPLLIEEAKGCNRIKVGVGPHACYTCSKQTLDRVAQLSEELNLPITIHHLESPSEIGTSMEVNGMHPTDHLLRSGIIKPSTLLVHCVHLNERDIELFAVSQSSVAHNPQSNMKIASGISPVAEMLKKGINVSIGTDGACSNNDLDMWDEMRSAAMLQKVATMNSLVLPAYQMLQMVTVNGAKAIGMEGELGVIAEGALADLIVVDTRAPHFQPQHDVVSSLVYCGKASDVHHLFVDGKQLVRAKQLVGVDVAALAKDASERAQRIVNEVGI